MQLTHELRDAARNGMAEMSDKFRKSGGEIYQPAPGQPLPAPGGKRSNPIP
jgi:hypothetical protein